MFSCIIFYKFEKVVLSMNKKVRNNVSKKRKGLGKLYILIALGIASSTVFANAISSSNDVNAKAAVAEEVVEGISDLGYSIQEAYNQGDLGKAKVGIQELLKEKKAKLQDILSNSSDNLKEDELEHIKLEIYMLENYLKEFF